LQLKHYPRIFMAQGTIMRTQQKCLAAALLTCFLTGVAHSEPTDSDADKCSTKLTEIDAAIEAARKEGSMRKVATLKDLRVEVLRCVNKTKTG
jgi:hypothetical protein